MNFEAINEIQHDIDATLNEAREKGERSEVFEARLEEALIEANKFAMLVEQLESKGVNVKEALDELMQPTES